MAITHASKTRSVSSSSLPAVLWALAGSFAFTLVYSSAWLSHGQIEPLQIIFLRYAGGAALALIIMLAMERSLLAAKSPRPSLHFVRALTGSLGELCVISAPLYISLTDSTSIGLTDAVFALIFAGIFFKEKTTGLQRLAVVLAFCGAVAITRTDLIIPNHGQAWLGILLSFAGAVLFGAENAFIKTLASRERAIAIILYVNVLSTLYLAAFAAWSWQEMTLSQWIETLSLGPIALFAQYCWIQALARADLSIVAPVGYVSIPFATFLSFVILGTLPGANVIFGAALVMAGGVILARLEPHSENRELPDTSG